MPFVMPFTYDEIKWLEALKSIHSRKKDDPDYQFTKDEIDLVVNKSPFTSQRLNEMRDASIKMLVDFGLTPEMVKALLSEKMNDSTKVYGAEKSKLEVNNRNIKYIFDNAISFKIKKEVSVGKVGMERDEACEEAIRVIGEELKNKQPFLYDMFFSNYMVCSQLQNLQVFQDRALNAKNTDDTSFSVDRSISFANTALHHLNTQHMQLRTIENELNKDKNNALNQRSIAQSFAEDELKRLADKNKDLKGLLGQGNANLKYPIPTDNENYQKLNPKLQAIIRVYNSAHSTTSSLIELKNEIQTYINEAKQRNTFKFTKTNPQAQNTLNMINIACEKIASSEKFINSQNVNKEKESREHQIDSQKRFSNLDKIESRVEIKKTEDKNEKVKESPRPTKN